MIHRVTIRNFKSLVDVTVDLGAVTVLIGRSGTGKTNFVEAIKLLRDLLTHRNAQVQREQKALLQSAADWGKLISITALEPSELHFGIEFTVPGIPALFCYELLLGSNAGQSRSPQQPLSLLFRRESLRVGKNDIFAVEGQKWVTPPDVIAAPQLSNQLVLGTITGLEEATAAYFALTQGIGCYAFPDTVLSVSTGGAYSDVGLRDDGANFVQSYGAIASDLRLRTNRLEMAAAMQQLDSSIKGIDLEMPSLQRVVVNHRFDHTILPLDLARESEGFRRFLAHLIALYQVPPKQTLIFEEPEKGIHPGALAVLADQFKACPEANRGQVILTTHSPELLNHFPPEDLRVVEIENYASRIGPVAEDQREAVRDQLLKPGELLTVELARVASTTNP